MTRVIFDAFAALAILFAGLMVVTRHAVRSVLSLVVAFFALAASYVMLGAPFIGALQVIVYAGAILVLFLFVLMLLNIRHEDSEKDPRPIQHILGGGAILIFTIILVALLSKHGTPPGLPPASEAAAPRIGDVARAVYADYLLPFEALSVLLLAALVGAFVLVSKENRA